MSYIKAVKVKGQIYYQEVEAYRNAGRKCYRVLKHLGKELPEGTRYRKGYNGVLLTEGKRVQVFKVPNLNAMEFIGAQGVLKEYRMKNGVEKALVIFDKPIRKHKDWLFPFEMLGNIKKDGKNEVGK